jgi:thymidylate synthase (FAD)
MTDKTVPTPAPIEASDKPARLSPGEAAEIEQQRAESFATRRVTVPALEEILYQPFPVLDHGFVRVIDYMGDDGAVVQAARVSYGKGTRKVSDDKGLIRYLLRHGHSTPFEMCEIKLHVKLPIFVARQWIRHRTANVNEYSARYSVLDREFYVPDRDYLEARREEAKLERRIAKAEAEGQSDLIGKKPPVLKPQHTAAQSVKNRQGRGEILPDREAEEVLRTIHAESARAYTIYMHLLNEDDAGRTIDPEKRGLARELSRMVLPTNVYTQWYWKIDLHNLLHFLALRTDPHAQYEIRAYADAIAGIAARWVPLTYGAFHDYQSTGAHLSGPALAVLRRLLRGEKVEQKESGLNPREWRELMAILGRGDSSP